eukprot:5883067-Pyramimonas_sp.AAC.1
MPRSSRYASFGATAFRQWRASAGGTPGGTSTLPPGHGAPGPPTGNKTTAGVAMGPLDAVSLDQWTSGMAHGILPSSARPVASTRSTRGTPRSRSGKRQPLPGRLRPAHAADPPHARAPVLD